MTIPTRDARIDVYQGHDRQPNVDEDPDVTIPGSDIEGIQISTRTDEIMDDVSIALRNREDIYTQEYPLQQADRITFAVPMEGEVAYGGGMYGGVSWGGPYHITWTGRIIDVDKSRESPDAAFIDIKARDYPADILSNRQVTNAYIGEDVGAIIRDIVRRKAPEVDRSHIPDLGYVTDAKYSSADCWDAILDLSARADAIVRPEGQALHIDTVDSLPYRFEVEDRDLYSPIDTSSDDTIKNIVRIDSGENRKLEDEQPTVDAGSFVRVDEGGRITVQLRARKAQVHSVDLYVQSVSEDDSIELRLQSDEGGSPVDIEDTDSDLASASWGPDNLPDDGWKAFFFDEHTLADRDPWLIIESGETGHDLGHNAQGDLAYQSYYPHPLNFEVSEPDSIDEYGMREIRIERANLKTLTAVRGAARSELARRAWPTKAVEFDARSERAHYLEPGDRIDVNRPEDDVAGEHIVTDVARTWSAGRTVLETSVTAEWRKGVLAPIEID